MHVRSRILGEDMLQMLACGTVNVGLTTCMNDSRVPSGHHHCYGAVEKLCIAQRLNLHRRARHQGHIETAANGKA